MYNMSHLKSSVNPLVTRLFPQLYYNSISIVQLLMDRQRRYGLSHAFSLPDSRHIVGGQLWPRCITPDVGPHPHHGQDLAQMY